MTEYNNFSLSQEFCYKDTNKILRNVKQTLGWYCAGLRAEKKEDSLKKEIDLKSINQKF